MIHRCLSTLWATRNSDVYNIYSYAILLIAAALLSLETKADEHMEYIFAVNNERMKWRSRDEFESEFGN